MSKPTTRRAGAAPPVVPEVDWDDKVRELCEHDRWLFCQIEGHIARVIDPADEATAQEALRRIRSLRRQCKTRTAKNLIFQWCLDTWAVVA